MLRPGNVHAGHKTVAILKRLVAAFREAWPEARIVLRGDVENRIKELKLDLKADPSASLRTGRTSCHRFLANQFRLLLHAAAFVLMGALREGLHGTELAAGQVATIRLKLLKVGVRVRETARRVWLHLSVALARQTAPLRPLPGPTMPAGAPIRRLPPLRAFAAQAQPPAPHFLTPARRQKTAPSPAANQVRRIHEWTGPAGSVCPICSSISPAPFSALHFDPASGNSLRQPRKV